MTRFLVMMAVTALLTVAWAVPVFAAASPTANCIGQLASDLNRFSPRFGGQEVSSGARAGETSGNATFCAHNR